MTAARRASRWQLKGWRNPRVPTTLTVSFRGGPECWWEVHARGEVARFPGHVALHDLMSEVCQLGRDPYVDPADRFPMRGRATR